MIKIQKNYDLQKFNTFGVKAKTKFFTEIEKEEDFIELLETKEFKEDKKLFLGGGSNVLFTEDFKGIVILNKLKGIKIINENENEVLIKSMGGEKWDDLVNFVVDKGYWGIENLALIPGSVGASPVQNIGAYGVELKDILENVETYEIATGQKKVFSCVQCEFGYRDSVFKNKLKGKYFISAIILKLSKIPNKHFEYKALKEYIEKNSLKVSSSKDISKIVSEIRNIKLPDPKVLGNAGSFFKNVYITKEQLKNLRETYPDIPSFEEDDLIKIPTGWLIENCGPRPGGASWKGYREGNVGMHEKQALVLVNYGGATGKEIKDFAEKVIDSVYQKFGLKITPEVNFV